MRLPAILVAAAALPAFAAEPPPINLIQNPSFEAPAIKGQTPELEGGNPGKVPEGTATSWTHFQAPLSAQEKDGGKIAVGLTNQIARTGKQSVFVDFQKVSATRRNSFLMTDVLPCKAGQRYRIGLWGRIDRKRPLTLDQRRAVLRVEVEYFSADQETQTGETDYRTQMIPGSLNRLLFSSTKWNEYYTTVRTPEDAAFIKVAFYWEPNREDGAVDGQIYFDDGSITEVAGGGSRAPLDPSMIKPKPDEPDPDAPDAPDAPEKPDAAAPAPAPAPGQPAAPK